LIPPFPPSLAVGSIVPFLEPLLLFAVLAGAMLSLLTAGLAGFRLAKRRAAPQRAALNMISELTPDGLKQKAPYNSDRLARAAVNRLWALTEPVMTRQRQLLEQNGELQRRYGQARALIDLMAEFNQVMQLAAVLDRLSFGLSRFFAGDGVAIWIRASQGQFELNVYKPVIAFAFLESLVLLADAMDSFRRHCVEGLAANRKRIDELMRQSLMLVTALAPTIGYDNAARIAKAAHLNGTSLRDEALASGLVDAGEFDALVRPEAMLAPYD